MRLARYCLAAAVALSPLALGCSPTAYNVRAFRAYAHEDSNLRVAAHRAKDADRALQLVDELLLKTPYSPGDAWVRDVPLTDAKLKQIKKEIQSKEPYSSGQYEIPIMSIYAIHLERVLAKAKKRSGDAKYPSILKALGDLSGNAGGIQGAMEEQEAAVRRLVAAEAEVKVEREKWKRANRGRQRPAPSPALDAAKKKVDKAEDEAEAAEKKLDVAVRAAAKAATSENGRAVLKDSLRVISVAYRVDVEALAILPIVVVHAAHSVGSGKVGLNLANAPQGLKDITELPDHVAKIEEELKFQFHVVEDMTKRLSEARKIDLEATAGMALRESMVDQIAGVTWESLKIRAKGGGEAFFYNQIQTPSGSQGDSRTNNKVVRNYAGRTRRLEYNVDPIFMLGGKLDVALDWINLPEAADLNLGFKTDRVISSGGNIDSSGSLSQQLGVSGTASDVLDLGLGILGVRTNVKTAQFTSGSVRVVNLDPTDGETEAAVQTGQSAPLQIRYLEIDIGYDISFLMPEFAGKYYIEQLTIGARYFKYELPRILYEMEVTSAPDADTKNLRFLRESPVQELTSEFYMGGVNARFGTGESKKLGFFGNVGIFFGGGPAQVEFAQSTDADQIDSYPRDRISSFATAVDMDLGAGVKYRIFKPTSRLQFYVEAEYAAKLIYTTRAQIR